MYGPDEHHIDPRNPANWQEPKLRYEIVANKRVVCDYDSEDQAKAAVFNAEDYFGRDLSVFEIDMDMGDTRCIMSVEWDEDIQRYLED